MITKNFIKQCEQAEELQAWYRSNVKNVHEGDRYICQCKTCTESMFVNYVKDSDIDYINERDMTDVDPTYAAMVSLSGVGEFGAFWDDGGFIYLPTQERLQEMIWQGLDEYEHWVSKLYDFILDLPFEPFSMNEIWLMFFLHEKYHKIWTGEKWKEVK